MEPSPPLVSKPGAVLFDHRQRRAELSDWPARVSKAYCRPERICAYEPVSVIDSKYRATGQTAARQGLSLWAGVTEYLRSGSVHRLEQGRQVLNAWVDADALKKTKGHMPLARHFLKRALLPTITAYAVMRDLLDIPPDERRKIEIWLARGVDLTDRDSYDRLILSDANNSRYSRDAVNMAWGILIIDEGAYQKGIQRFKAALADMRPDGSLPWETIRGAKAVSYQNLAISILIPMAEMAHGQGLDLYAFSQSGRTIHDAIRFLIEAEKDSVRVHPYTNQLQDKIRLGNHLHWTEIYLARFPDHANTPGLHDLRRRHHFLTGRGNDFSGGNLSCAFAAPETNPILTKRAPRKKIEAIRKTSIVPRVACPEYLD